MKLFSSTVPLLFTVFLISAALTSHGQDFPEPMKPLRLVNDFAGILSENEFKTLEYKLERYEDTTSSQVYVVIIKSLGGYDIAQYSAELGQKWGVGQSGKDNGILILAAMDDRDVYISTGYGLEATVTDAASKRIIENYIIPNFRNQDYYTGFDQATSIIIGLAAGEFKAEDIGAERGEEIPASSLFKFFLPIVLIIIISFSRYRRMSRNHYGNNTSFWAILALMMASGGGRGGSGFDNFSGGSGGFGGFGGGGGGGFGGGGAGGSW